MGILKAIFGTLKIPLLIIFSIMAYYMIMQFIYIFIEMKKRGQKKLSKQNAKPKQPNILKRLFIMIPKQMAIDRVNMPDHYFKPQGFIIYEGEQGSGKTVALVRDTLLLQEQYPKCKVLSNLGYEYANERLHHWRQLINYKNGTDGVIVQMDETQNWFSSNQSKNFPPEMLQVVTQNRKNRRIILGTAQSFYMVAKSIRTQTMEVRRCITLAGCFTIVLRKKPIIDSDGDIKEFKNRGVYCFVHTPKIRESYDTYKIIESLSNSGFQERPTEVNNKIYNISK